MIYGTIRDWLLGIGDRGMGEWVTCQVKGNVNGFKLVVASVVYINYQVLGD